MIFLTDNRGDNNTILKIQFVDADRNLRDSLEICCSFYVLWTVIFSLCILLHSPLCHTSVVTFSLVLSTHYDRVSGEKKYNSRVYNARGTAVVYSWK
jgi:hypothetical protein